MREKRLWKRKLPEPFFPLGFLFPSAFQGGGEILLDKVGCHGPIGGGGDHLAQGLFPQVPHGEHPGEVGLGGFPGQHIPSLVQVHLALVQLAVGDLPHRHEQAVAGDLPVLAGLLVVAPAPR